MVVSVRTGASRFLHKSHLIGLGSYFFGAKSRNLSILRLLQRQY